MKISDYLINQEIKNDIEFSSSLDSIRLTLLTPIHTEQASISP